MGPSGIFCGMGPLLQPASVIYTPELMSQWAGVGVRGGAGSAFSCLEQTEREANNLGTLELGQKKGRSDTEMSGLASEG